MGLFSRFRRIFFKRVETMPVPEPTVEELVDGKAFTIKHYPLTRTHYVCPNDRFRATIREDGEEIAVVEEEIGMTMVIDTISTLRFNDALGYKHAFGALFGQRKQ